MEDFFLKLSIMLVPALLAVTCHEVSHGFIAGKFGDGTARMMGRLTLNPLKHLDIFGTLMIFLVGVGWAKPVPVNFNNLRHPKRDMVWVALAGPVTNFSLAAVSAFLMRGVIAVTSDITGGTSAALVLQPIVLMLAFSVYVNLLLALFNLIPVPPLDGGRVAVGLLPYRQAEWLARIEPFGMIVIVVLVFFTDLFSYVLLPFLDMGIRLLAGPHSPVVFGVTKLLMR